MNLWIIGIGLIIVIISLIIFIINKKQDDNGIDLDSRLNVIKNRWDDVCKKIKNKMFGC